MLWTVNWYKHFRILSVWTQAKESPMTFLLPGIHPKEMCTCIHVRTKSQVQTAHSTVIHNCLTLETAQIFLIGQMDFCIILS